jgi:GAF domain-containing protein
MNKSEGKCQSIDNRLALKQLRALITNETDLTANLANASAFLADTVADISWIGLYLFNEKDQELILGPFQGKVACTRIKIGQGVCGTAFLQQKTIIVGNVHQFKGHIACDVATNAEIVIPLTAKQQKVGVLDVDSTTLQRFGEKEKKFFEQAAAEIEKCWY